MEGHPVRDLVDDLGGRLGSIGHIDRVFTNDMKKIIRGDIKTITPEGFKEIQDVPNPAKIAFVDGGDRPLEESPNFLITVNRVYFSMFRGRERINPSGRSRIQFFESVISRITSDKNPSVEYETRLFTHNKEDEKYIPRIEDLPSKDTSKSSLERSRTGSFSRSFAEWKFARHVIENELNAGDILVMDRSLQTGYENEQELAGELYKAAINNKVILCGLSKTSRLMTASGEPLLARISEIASNVPYSRWYVEVARKLEHVNNGYVMAVKLHPKSQYIYRFEILCEQYEKMTETERGRVLGSIAANSNDVAMPGYPYGLVDADRFAQVRNDEKGLYKGYIEAEIMRHPEGRKMLKYSRLNGAHEHLNGVTS
ncbi:MAG: DNA double-strand break repair nuclease NurA [Nitrosopumilus sp.]|nr:DNA double-strand break repair nuclease NurA [Nitrosopumilus sp.]MDA7942665.1 DNA double-strand break repair nuclease NurA [Nitrosopumilus sp.]MDA7960436.1 DNA double-strand break repair nuclease NurA [Nitrosopumilus sp.]MDA7998565.1 DNA double-strand break repair nuclease NurA [Nitrosopumilus sp.]